MCKANTPSEQGDFQPAVVGRGSLGLLGSCWRYWIRGLRLGPGAWLTRGTFVSGRERDWSLFWIGCF